MNILAHTCFIGTTGYSNHARSFFIALNKYHTVKVRNDTVGTSWTGFSSRPHDNESYMSDEIKDMLFQQSLINKDGQYEDYPIYSHNSKFKPDVHIVLSEMDSHYFYDDYDGYKIAYNVWESTRYPEKFFNRLFYFDEVWVPSTWQKNNLIDQGYPESRIYVIPEGVDGVTFHPIKNKTKKDKFTFLLVGRWEYRKSTTEIIRTFGETFKENVDDVELVCLVENNFPFDGFKSTKERIEHYKLNYKNVHYLSFLTGDEYVKLLQNSDVFVSASRSEGWFLPLIESMACGIPSIYTNWGAQLEYAENKGIPVDICGLIPANFEHKNWPGDYCEPDFNDLSKKMKDSFINYKQHKNKALIDSDIIRKEFTWDMAAQKANKVLENINNDFVFITTGNIGYMPVIEQLVNSILEFSKRKIIVYGVDCDVPFDKPNLIKRQINPKKHSKHDKWYWKQHACIESLKEEYDNFIWIDGDVVVNYNIDEIKKYFKDIENYPISDVHVQEDFFGWYEYKGKKYSQRFNEEISKKFNIKRLNVFTHACMFIYNKECKWWFEELLDLYYTTPLDEYEKYLLWNDEGADNFLRFKYNCNKVLPLSNFDTSGYDGDDGETNKTLHHFHSFWNKIGPKNFGKIYGYQYIPENKNNILYFHGNKNIQISEHMIKHIKHMRDGSFYNTMQFYTDKYKLEDFSDIYEIEGGTLSIAEKYGWHSAVFHEIYNLRDYYLNREKRIFNGDTVVDLGANIGIFNRWAYSEGATKVISFEPDKRYYQLLKLNADPRSILFNAAMSDTIGEIEIYESKHFGGTTTKEFLDYENKYKVKTYNLDYLFESKLVEKIDFLKIDIEGSEIETFQGISDENLMKIRNISMEYHHEILGFDVSLREKLIKRLTSLGFNSYVLFLGLNNELQLIYFYR